MFKHSTCKSRELGRVGSVACKVGVAVLVLAAALALALPAAQAAEKPAVVVKMKDTPPVYIPKTVTIKVGQSVEWINSAASLHDVNANPADAIKKGDVVLPKGAKPFDSGFMAPGAKFTHTFTTPGRYQYFCVPHEKDGMLGVVIVKK